MQHKGKTEITNPFSNFILRACVPVILLLHSFVPEKVKLSLTVFLYEISTQEKEKCLYNIVTFIQIGHNRSKGKLTEYNYLYISLLRYNFSKGIRQHVC